MSSSRHDEDRLAQLMASCSNDPLKFVRMAFPWGEKGELEKYDGPDEWQIKVLNQIKEGLITVSQAIQIAVASGHGPGKAHDYETIVPTPIGMRRWGDLEPGDEVFGQDGSATEIVACYHYSAMRMYRVLFDDGSFSDVSAGHLWNVRGRQERRHNLTTWRTMETSEILTAGVMRSNGSEKGTRTWEIPIQGAVQFEAKETPLHPYLVGVWLGDGKKGDPSYTKKYPEVANKVRSFGYDVVDRANDTVKYVIGVKEHFKNGVFLLGSHERYIPDEYKYNCVASRRFLLEGLLDTDGEVGKEGSIGYSTTSRQLADDVIWLARSLGCKAKYQPAVKQGWYPDENGERIICRDCYRITLSVPWNPFTLEHRRVRYRPVQARYLTRWIDRIEPIESADGMCITVAAQDGLYQTNDFIVTHNSGLVSWLILWALATMPDTKGVVTANTEIQLRTKTWAELAKWHRLFIAQHWFTLTATAIYSVDPAHERTWRIDAVAWSDRNVEAFAGLHNQGKRVILLLDEASAIPDIIWETAEGALTDDNTQIIWGVFGNPTRNVGRFRECFGRFRHRWQCHQVDSRIAKLTNKVQIQQWIDDYGEDSDFVRVRVRGVFPRAGTMQFIGADLAEAAMADSRDSQPTVFDPLIMAVDVARFGGAQSVIRFRRGRDARSIKPIKFRDVDLMTLAARVANEYEIHHPDVIFVDEGGMGAGVVDRCRMLRLPVIGVAFGARAQDGRDEGHGSNRYYNLRAQMWGLMRAWLSGGMLDNDPELLADLTGVEYGYRTLEGVDAIILERKADMAKRGLASPDNGDALAMTFAYPVQKSDHTSVIAGRGRTSGFQAEYQPLAAAWSINAPQQQSGSGQHWLPGGITPWNTR